jgi:hypothetical protein
MANCLPSGLNATELMPPWPAIPSANNATFTVGTVSSLTITTTGDSTIQFTETGALPTGITFADNGNGTATLAGTPAPGAGGTYAIVITAGNGVSHDASQAFTLTVRQAPPVAEPPWPSGVTLIPRRFGKKTKLVAAVLFTGGLAPLPIVAPYQKPTFQAITAAHRDIDGDGILDSLLFTAHRGERHVSTIVPV